MENDEQKSKRPIIIVGHGHVGIRDVCVGQALLHERRLELHEPYRRLEQLLEEHDDLHLMSSDDMQQDFNDDLYLKIKNIDIIKRHDLNEPSIRDPYIVFISTLSNADIIEHKIDISLKRSKLSRFQRDCIIRYWNECRD